MRRTTGRRIAWVFSTLGVNLYLKGQDLKLLADLLLIDTPGQKTRYRLLVCLQAIF